jgi:3-phosphoshikimate 1-carboxyvinyltransferase
MTEGVAVRHSGAPLPSAPHVAMTVRALRAAGATVEVGEHSWQVAPGRIQQPDTRIEPDLSTASAFLAAAAATGGRVTVPGWPTDTAQPGRLLPELLAAMGCRWELGADGLTVEGPGSLLGLDVDLHEYGEVVPTLTALAVLATTPSRLRGIAHLRLQETDRLAGLAGELGRLGALIEVTPDGLAITPNRLRGGVVLDPQADHRLAMAYAVVGLRVPGVEVDDIATTGKTVPDFPALWAQMLAG